jgi:hypothetical protein
VSQLIGASHRCLIVVESGNGKHLFIVPPSSDVPMHESTRFSTYHNSPHPLVDICDVNCDIFRGTASC